VAKTNSYKYVTAMCMVYFLNSASLEIIDHKFLKPGHAHVENSCDQ